MSENPEIEKLYAKEMDKLLQNGDVEKIEESPVKASDPDRYINYIPHLAVAKLDKISSRVRPVYDGSCKNNQNISLN